MRGILGIIAALIAGGAAYWFYTHYTPMDTTTTQNTAVLAVAGQEVTYFESVKGYLVKPTAEGTYPGVVMIHENRGLRPEIKKAAEDLAKEGYMVLAVDLYGGVVMETQEEARAFSANYDQAKGMANLRAAVSYLRAQGAPKVGSWGWCFGGSRSLDLALSGEQMDATVIYYGSRPVTDPEKLKVITWPVLGIYGREDAAIPNETVADFKAALALARVDHTITAYGGVGHAFANPSNPNHHPENTADAWAKTVEFLNKNLK